MRSLRTRLILISTLVSSMAIVGLGWVSWHFMMRAIEESVDLRLEGMATRLIRDVHPRSDQDALEAALKANFGDEVTDGRLSLIIREVYPGQERELASIGWSASTDAALPGGFPAPDPDPERRPEPGKGRGGRPPHQGGRPGGPPEEERWWQDEEPLDRKPPPREDEERPRPPRHIEFCNAEVGGEEWRFIAVQERGFAVFSGLNITLSNPGVGQLRRSLFVGVPVALLLIAGGGWLVADRAMRPLRRITETAGRISVQDLSERMPRDPHSDPEIERLTEVLNAMMARLETSFNHASRFSADVSHELRTPITVMQGEIESALRECEPGKAEESSLLVLREELDRLKSIIRSLLMLSQADVGGLIRKLEPVDLFRELEALAEDAEILAEEAGLKFLAETEEGLIVPGESILLRQAILNLINNAIKFSVEGGFVRLSGVRKGDEVHVSVENDGPAIAGEDRERIFDRFFRADRARSRGVDGFGLGLSLTRAIIEGHGGHVTLEGTEAGVTRFVIRLKT
jgi:two-component system, OmpR family, heavy metal sensor histidine kinase CusS